MSQPQILAMGGYPDDVLLDHVLGLARGSRVLYVPTAVSEYPDYTVLWYDRLRGRGTMTHLSFFPWPPANLHELAVAHDVILVSGGNTANAIAIWRVHDFDEILREAWQSGVLLTGWSAGMICWFEHGVTDSFGPDLAPMECLGFLPGSACPHYDGEERRRPRLQAARPRRLPARACSRRRRCGALRRDRAARGRHDPRGSDGVPRQRGGRGAARGARDLALSSAIQASARSPSQIGVRTT